jgi:hypothetical protein
MYNAFTEVLNADSALLEKPSKSLELYKLLEIE